jgi:broad specificity phosphatase PhoE
MGRVRAGKLAGRLKPYRLGALVSSIEPKAQQTAEIISEILGLTHITVNDLHEHDRSNSPFYKKNEFRLLVRNFFKEPDTLVFGNETANQAFERFRRAVDLTLQSYTGRNTAIVSHGTVISLFVSSLTGLDPFRFWQELGSPSLIVLDLEDREMLDMENIT